MNTRWTAAVKDLRKLGIRVKTSYSACCPGCIDAGDVDPDQPVIFSIRSRFDGSQGGILYHQNIADTELADRVVETLYKYHVPYLWDMSEAHTIQVDLSLTSIN